MVFNVLNIINIIHLKIIYIFDLRLFSYVGNILCFGQTVSGIIIIICQSLLVDKPFMFYTRVPTMFRNFTDTN